MRSYETGKYAVLKDGNFQLTLARILASDFDNITLTIPSECSDLDELLKRFDELNLTSRVVLLEAQYGKNAVETRRMFWNGNEAFCNKSILVKYDLLVTDITGYSGPLPFINNFNITELPGLDRPYIDEFFEQDLDAIGRSLFTTVINPCQRDYIVELRPDLANKVIVNTRVAHPLLMPRSPVEPAPSGTIFWPFRISDKAYKFEEFLEEFERAGLEYTHVVVITDPNDTYDLDKPYVRKVKPSKDEYYWWLSMRPTVVMLDDIDTVLHPGTVEFFFFGCPVVTFKNKLLDNHNTITCLSQLSAAVRNVSYRSVELANFVYTYGGLDPFYNKDFIRAR